MRTATRARILDMLRAVTNAQPAPQAWETLAGCAARLDPDATLTVHDYARATLSAPAPPPPPEVTMAELPYLPVAKGGDGRDTDLEITGILGEGGMGRVLLGRQRSLRRDVAIKVVKAEHTRGDVLEALLTEGLVTGSIEHPSVVPVHALGRDAEGRPVLVMKRIDGVSWQDLARNAQHAVWASIAPETGDRLDAHLEILMAVCSAAHCAHEKGFVHRDLKLANVMIGPSGEVYLVDWGIATRAAAPGAAAHLGALVGTPAYMAPEMVMGDLAHIDARTDVYLLGATLHAVLTGAARHRGDALYDVLLSARDSRPFAYGPDVPPELAAICTRAMSASPTDRYASARDLRLALASFRRHRGSIALSDEAAARFEAIPAGGDARRVHGMLTESRFGFMQALRAWPENAAAEAGLTACLERMIEHEIAQGDAAGARALLSELRAPRPELGPRIAALEAELAAAAARLAALERDRDLTIGAGLQLGLVAILPAFAAGTAVYLFGLGDGTSSPEMLVGLPAAAFLLLLAGFMLARRRLRSAISRKGLAMLLLVPGAALVHRILAVVQGAPQPAILVGDLVTATVLTGAIAIAVTPRLALAAFPFALGALGVTLRPELALPIFAASLVSGSALLFGVWRRSVQG
jgi:eukaryotic-like serine/threonine-protein kinase